MDGWYWIDLTFHIRSQNGLLWLNCETFTNSFEGILISEFDKSKQNQSFSPKSKWVSLELNQISIWRWTFHLTLNWTWMNIEKPQHVRCGNCTLHIRPRQRQRHSARHWQIVSKHFENEISSSNSESKVVLVVKGNRTFCYFLFLLFCSGHSMHSDLIQGQSMTRGKHANKNLPTNVHSHSAPWTLRHAHVIHILLRIM